MSTTQRDRTSSVPQSQDTSGLVYACPNCGESVEARFCGRCGQGRDEGTPTIAEWLRESVQELTSLEGRAWRTARMLTTSPGHLTKAWMEGRRASFSKPLRVFLIALFVLVVASRFFAPEGGALAGFLEGLFADDPVGGVGVEAMTARFAAVLQWFGLAMVPAGAAVLALFFRRQRFVIHLVHALHLFSFVVLAYVAAIGLSWATTAGPDALEWLIFTAFAAAIGWYLFQSYRSVYGERRIPTALKLTGTVLLTVVIWVAGAVGWVTLL